jgi:hypothetical protein
VPIQVLEKRRGWSAGKTEFYLIGRNSVIIKCPSTIASFLREPDLASRKPVLTPGVARCANHAGREDQRTVKLISKDGGREDGSS